MVSTISSTVDSRNHYQKERIAHLQNNAVLPSDNQDGHLTLLDKYFFKTRNF